MGKCTEYWCERYRKTKGQCDHCEKQERIKDNPELRVILKQRADNLMELDNVSGKDRGQER